MKKSFLLTAASALVALPLAVSAETINLYGWQNHSWEFVETDVGGTTSDVNRIQGNAANIGFAASVDTGVNGIHVNLQCEQFTYVNHFAGGTGWCNRNSKIALAHPTLGEVMFATWLLPYNEAVAQWVDPFYDAGADSHTSIMGSVGGTTIFYNTGQFEGFSTDPNGGIEFNYTAFDFDQGFNRRQEHIIQYWSPNVHGFVFRYAQTAGSRDDTPAPVGEGDLDPVIRSTSLAYTNGPFWAAATYQEHEDWAAAGLGNMNSSDAESYRFAARYILDMGDGMSIQLSAMYEDLEYEFEGTSSIDGSMGAIGLGHFATTYEVANSDGDFVNPDLSGGGDITFEREAFLVSGKVKFGGPLDFRFSYMDADNLDVSCTTTGCGGEWRWSGADAWNVGLFYTMPAGTELRLTYSEVSNEENAGYGQGISGTGLSGLVGAGSEVEMFAIGIVHWFD